MNERLKKLRTELNLTQEEFGEKIGIKSRAHISALESGKRTLIDRIVYDICREFNVNEQWLRNGTGEIFIEPNTFSLDEYAKSKGATQFELELLKSYFEFPEHLRKEIENNFKTKILPRLKSNYDDNDIVATKEENSIDAEVESYRKELEAEAKGETLLASEKPKGA